MSIGTTGGKGKYLVGLSLLACVVFTMVVIFYDESYFLAGRFQKVVHVETSRPRNRKVLLPAGFHFPDSAIKNHLRGTSSEKWESIQLKDTEVADMPPHEPGRFKPTDSLLYGMSTDPYCERKSHKTLFATDDSERLTFSLKKFLRRFKEDAKTYHDPYNMHLQPVLRQFMNENKLDSSWFRLSGSSVWLKDYNVHFVVSRLMASEEKDRQQPRISMLLAQIYDEEWKEVEDVRLVFPSNSVEDGPGFRVNGQDFSSYRFPRLLPIPFDLGEVGRYWGAEDPRVVLIKNKNGHEEPLIIFNSFIVTKNADKSVPDVEGTRSMFMSFPFQFQKGKQIEAAETEVTVDQWFSRIKQVTIHGEDQQKVEKNWTPFVSSHGDYHEHVMFVTQFEPLKVIKCELAEDSGECVAETKDVERQVGPLRGGTPLLSVKRIDERDEEYFAGFARAHLNECGCGSSFYRPNLVVVARKGKRWSLSHVSSSIDLGMDVLPWNRGGNVCDGVNVMIPNGIEFWDLERDVLSLDASVTDMTVERVHLHGVLRALENARFWETEQKKNSISPVSCAMESSKDFCSAYASKYIKPSLRSIFR